MNKKIIMGCITAVVLLVLVSFSPSITAYVSYPDIDIPGEEDTTPIGMTLQTLQELYRARELQNPDDDCGCEDDSLALEWGFPVICFFLAYVYVFAFCLLIFGINSQLVFIVENIGESYNCQWA